MRPIEFRIYCEQNKEMMHVDSLNFDEEGKVWFATAGGDVVPYFENHKDWHLMQYTGLKDKNKQKYCQDDIVRYKGKHYRLIKGTYKFELLGFKEPLQDDPYDFFSEGAFMQGEIVGNIHENKDFLEVAEE
ncbi:YopX family protein [Listeria rocourtiae]|uniref:YopX family protein n=1 Tax=Listeria rocourtiae TaxID=647910 RepID=UPI003D2F62AD